MFGSEDGGLESTNFSSTELRKELSRETLAKSLSSQLWNIEWNHFISLFGEIAPGINLRVASHEEITSFLNDQTLDPEELIEGRNEAFSFNKFDVHKRKFLSEFCDGFSIYDERQGIMVGAVIGQTTDWSTYYIRYVLLTKRSRGAGIFQGFIGFLSFALAAKGIERLEIEISPLNTVQLHLLNKLGFCVSSTSVTDRWGYLLRFTKFFTKEAQLIFMNQFCAGPINQLSDSTAKNNERGMK